ncbi:MAG: vitamin K epoxide reductase family protein [Dysgonomonas sp.]|nr:vitamin K epoxide reductase family protein [Dysgonomonas sp.]
MNNNKNVLSLFLKQLKVKFTNTYVNKLYDEHPQKDSLAGISEMLSDYKIENLGIKMNNKDEFTALETPFLISLDNNITLVRKLTNEYVYCVWKGEKLKLSIKEFKDKWDGIALLAEKNEKSAEPNYKENHIKELFHIFRKNIFILCVAILFLIGFITNTAYSSPGLLSLLLTNLVGAYIGFLLIQKQMSIQNNHADKICSVLKNGNCNSVLDSPAAKFMGIIGWSEVGLSYFISNIIISVLFPQFIAYLALINICALPYSLWSIWYQKYKVKQWCPLCLIVQMLLWVVFIINLLSGHISFPSFETTDILLIPIIYVLPFLVINTFLPYLISEKQLQYALREINDLKMNPEVFKALLKQQLHHDISPQTSQVIWGNPNANILMTVITNPHCEPCARMHKEIEKLLKKAENKICVQYIFSSFNEELECSNKFLIAAYLSEYDRNMKQRIFNEWFEYGKYNREQFFDNYKFAINEQAVETEATKHREWKERNPIYGTPTILINGYEFPEKYSIEDIKHFTEMNI